MKLFTRAFIFFPFLIILSCNGLFPSQSKDVVPADHTSNKNGAYHMPGSDNPIRLGGCATDQCHGTDLKGSVAYVDKGQTVTPSCYQCHGAVWENESEGRDDD